MQATLMMIFRKQNRF